MNSYSVIMTIYTFDLMNQHSLSRLPSIQETLELCLDTCHDITIHLSESMVFSTHQKKQDFNKLVSTLGFHTRIIGRATADRAGVSYPISISRFCLKGRSKTNQTKYHQDLTMSTLSQVHPRLLLGLVTRLLECSLIAIRPFLMKRITGPLFNECCKALQTVISELTKVFTDSYQTTIPLVDQASISIEYENESPL
jgi:hypothetical protein